MYNACTESNISDVCFCVSFLSSNRKPFHLQLYHALQIHQNSRVLTKRGLIPVGKEKAELAEKIWWMLQDMYLAISMQAHMIIKYKEASKTEGLQHRWRKRGGKRIYF